MSCWYLLNSRLRRLWASTYFRSTAVSLDASKLSLSHHTNGDQSLTIEWILSSGDIRSDRRDPVSLNAPGSPSSFCSVVRFDPRPTEPPRLAFERSGASPILDSSTPDNHKRSSR